MSVNRVWHEAMPCKIHKVFNYKNKNNYTRPTVVMVHRFIHVTFQHCLVCIKGRWQAGNQYPWTHCSMVEWFCTTTKRPGFRTVRHQPLQWWRMHVYYAYMYDNTSFKKSTASSFIHSPCQLPMKTDKLQAKMMTKFSVNITMVALILLIYVQSSRVVHTGQYDIHNIVSRVPLPGSDCLFFTCIHYIKCISII